MKSMPFLFVSIKIIIINFTLGFSEKKIKNFNVMKKILFFALGLCAVSGYAQEGKVGINTMVPKATLEIKPNPKNSEESATTNEGLLIPRMSKTRVAGMASPQESTMVYVTDDASSPITSYKGSDARVAHIFSKGYYIFENGTWNAIKTKKEQANPEKIYECTDANRGQILNTAQGYFKCVYDEMNGTDVWQYNGIVQARAQNEIWDNDKVRIQNYNVFIDTKNIEWGTPNSMGFYDNFAYINGVSNAQNPDGIYGYATYRGIGNKLPSYGSVNYYDVRFKFCVKNLNDNSVSYQDEKEIDVWAVKLANDSGSDCPAGTYFVEAKNRHFTYRILE